MKRDLTKFLSLILAFVLSASLLSPAALAAEEGDGSNPQDSGETSATDATPTAPPVLELNKNKLDLEVGKEETLTVKGVPAGAAVEWSVGEGGGEIVEITPDPKNNSATVTAVGAGETTVTAACGGGKSEPCAVKVSPAPVTTFELAYTNPSCTLEPGGEKTFSVIINQEATDKTVTWSTADSEIATVDQQGTVTAVSPGKTTLTVTSNANGDKNDSLDIVVSGITLADYPASGGTALQPNTNTVLTPQKFGEAVNVKSWEWRSGDTSIARVLSGAGGGVVTGMGEGTVTITCVGGGYIASCKVTVARRTTSTVRGSLDSGLLRFSSLTGSSGFTGFEYLTALTVPPAQGTLYDGYASDANPGSGVASTDKYYFSGSNPRQVSNIVFVPKPDYNGDAVIRYTGYSSSGSAVSGEIIVPVKSDDVSLDYAVQAGEVLRFNASDFNDYCLTYTGKGLSCVSFTLPSSRYGKLYYNYTDTDIYERTVSSSDRFYRTGSPALSSVALVADDGYEGVFDLEFTGRDTAGGTFDGSARITVGDGGSTESGDINYTVEPGKRVYFDEDDFYDLCEDENDRGLDYVRFTSLPSSSHGVLYYDGSKVTTGASYDYDDELEDVYFLADDDYDGTVSIPFTGYDTRGDSFRGTVVIEVYEGGSGSSGDLTYTVDSGRRVNFDEDDFNDFCYDKNDRKLDYIRFTSLPSSSRGVLYYDRDTKVTTGSHYYFEGSGHRLIEDLSFTADDDYTGTAYLDFTGYDTRGRSFTGTVEVRVGWDEGDTEITYSGRPGRRIEFDEDDFSEACYSATGRQLSYVRFNSLPAASRGTLYYDRDTNVRGGTNYYYSGSNRLLEDVSFVPAASFTGTVSIPYTGQSTGGRSFSGTVTIKMSGSSSGVSPVNSLIRYSTTGRAVTFKRSDFAAACADSLPTGPVTVRLTAPSASSGRLHLNYASPSRYRAFVSGQNYSASELDQLSFVPKAGFSGTAAVPFTLYDAGGSSWSGVVSIDVTPATSSAYFSDLGGTRWAVPAVDFLRRYGVVSGVSATSYGPSQPMRRGDFVLMLHNAFSLPEASGGGFPDVPQNSYYGPAIASAREQNIIYAGSDGRFRPNDTITRLDAAVFLYRCLQSQGRIGAGSASSLTGFADAASVPSWAAEAMGALVQRGVFAGDTAGRLNPNSPLTRAEMAVILYQAVT